MWRLGCTCLEMFGLPTGPQFGKYLSTLPPPQTTPQTQWYTLHLDSVLRTLVFSSPSSQSMHHLNLFPGATVSSKLV